MVLIWEGRTTPGPLKTSGSGAEALSGDVEGAACDVACFLGVLSRLPAVIGSLGDTSGARGGLVGAADCTATAGCCAGSLTGCLALVGVSAVGLCFLVGGLASEPLLGCLRAEVGCTLLDFASGVPGIAALSFGRIPDVSGGAPAEPSFTVRTQFSGLDGQQIS